MLDDASFLTTMEAANIAGCTSRHITNLITRGEMSAERKDKKYIIQKSEFYRVFPQTMKKEKEPINSSIMQDNSRLSVENSMLKELCKSKDKELEFLRSQIEIFHREKDKLLDSLNAHTRLLEHVPHGKKGWSLFRRKK
jgi:esterase/lipase